MTRIPVALRWFIALLAVVVTTATLTPAASAATTRTLSVTATPTVAAVRSISVFTGTLTKSPARSAVKVQRKVGTRWVLAASGVSTRNGSYRISVVVPATLGVYAYRVFAPAKGTLKAAVSRTVRITALRKVVTSIKATPTSVPAGTPARISGTVRPYVAGTRVVIQKQVGASWTGVVATTVTSTGAYTTPVTPTTGTTYRAFVARATRNAPSYSIGVRVDTTPVIATTALPDANRDSLYSFKLTAVGNPGGTWSAAPLPAGLALNPSTGVISGTPTAAGDTVVAIGFTRTGGVAAPGKNLTLHVNPPAAPVISTSSLPTGEQGTPYTKTLLATGNPAGTWSAAPLPAGLSLDPSTGVISGTPTAVGTTQVVIGFKQTSTQLDAVGKTLPLQVLAPPPPVILTDSLPDGAALTPYSAQAYVAGDVAGTWSASGLPSGISINATTGVISGTTLLPTDASVTLNFTQTSTNLAATPVPVTLHVGVLGAATTPTVVAAGSQFSCRIDKSSKLWCWGYDDSGQLGDGATGIDPPADVTPTQVGTGTDWNDITAGSGIITERHACGIRGTVGYCWGSDKFGQLGSSSVAGSTPTPAVLNGLHSWKQLSAGWTSSCGVTTDGALYCWGDNGFGQLGVAGGNQATPERVGTGNTWTQVAVGYSHACATKADRTLWCWGANFRGQLGTGGRDASTTPAQVGIATDWKQVVTGAGASCATKTNGTLWCWGVSAFGALGNGTTVNDATTDELTPDQVGSDTNWARVTLGESTTCATKTIGELWCWGKNQSGQVGDGSSTDRANPVKIGTATDWSWVSAAQSHGCGVKSDDEVWCWGSNSKGEVGSNPVEASVPAPRKVVG